MAQKISRSLGIHDGPFHADEVTACALLLLFDLIDEDKIYRTRDSHLLATCEYVCDVGGKYNPNQKHFDHHQADYTGSLSSAGMILLYLKDQKILSSNLYQFFNDSLVEGIDAHDIGTVKLQKGTCFFSDVIANFLPIEYGSAHARMQEAFQEALIFTIGHLKRLKERFDYMQVCKALVEKEMEKNLPYLIFDKPIPWLESFFELGGENSPALFVVMPSQNHWKLRAIPPTFERRMEVRKPLPEAWAGLHEEELIKVTKIEGSVFCHKGRFISIWKTKEDAIKALNIVLGKKI